MIGELISVAVAGTATVAGYINARKFTRVKLRFVDAAHSPLAPWIAGAAAAVVATPFAFVLPLIGAGTAMVFGLGVGAGVAAGSREARHLGRGE